MTIFDSLLVLKSILNTLRLLFFDGFLSFRKILKLRPTKRSRGPSYNFLVIFSRSKCPLPNILWSLMTIDPPILRISNRYSMSPIINVTLSDVGDAIRLI